MIKGIISDFNGTLLFDSSYHYKAWVLMQDELAHVPLDLEEFNASYKGQRNELALQRLAKNHHLTFTPEQIDFYSERKEALYRELVKKEGLPLAPGVEDFLNEVKRRKIPFTIASSSIKANIDFFVSQFHLDRWVDPSCIVYDDGSFPNKVKMYEKASEILGIPLSDALIFEDSVTGMGEALKAGCGHVVAVHQETPCTLAGIAGSITDMREAWPYLD